MLTQSNLAGVKSTMSSTADGKVYNFRGINQSWPDDYTRWKGRGINAWILWHWQLHSCWDSVEFALTVFLTLYYVVAKYLVRLWGEQSHLWAFGLDLCNLLIISCLSAHFRSLKKELAHNSHTRSAFVFVSVAQLLGAIIVLFADCAALFSQSNNFSVKIQILKQDSD